MPVHPFPCHDYRDVLVTHGGPWKTIRVKGRHRPRDAYGIAGYAVETTKSAWGRIDLVHSKGRGSSVSTVDIFHLRQPRGGSVEVLIDGVKAHQFSTRAQKRESGVERIITSGRSFELRAGGDGSVRLFGVSLERSVPGVIVDALGIPGAKGRDQLVWDADVQRAQLAKTSPDLVVLEYGTNESGGDLQGMPRYEQDLRAVVKRLRGLRPQASCLLMGPSEWPERRPDGSYHPRSRTKGITEVQRRVAADAGCGFFDTLLFMGGPGSMVRWVAQDPPLALSDHVHFTDEGHHRLAKVLETALLEGLDLAR
jgi:lysophospholipase L1-like esterase